MIHVETEILRQSGTLMARTVEEMWESVSTLRRLAEDLDIAWEGGMASREVAERLRGLAAGIKQDTYLLDGQAQTLIRQANRWEESDQDWTVTYTGMQKGW